MIHYCGKYRLNVKCLIKKWSSKGKRYSVRSVDQLFCHNFLMPVIKLLTDARFLVYFQGEQLEKRRWEKRTEKIRFWRGRGGT